MRLISRLAKYDILYIVGLAQKCWFQVKVVCTLFCTLCLMLYHTNNIAWKHHKNWSHLLLLSKTSLKQNLSENSGNFYVTAFFCSVTINIKYKDIDHTKKNLICNIDSCVTLHLSIWFACFLHRCKADILSFESMLKSSKSIHYKQIYNRILLMSKKFNINIDCSVCSLILYASWCIT